MERETTRQVTVTETRSKPTVAEAKAKLRAVSKRHGVRDSISLWVGRHPREVALAALILGLILGTSRGVHNRVSTGLLGLAAARFAPVGIRRLLSGGGRGARRYPRP